MKPVHHLIAVTSASSVSNVIECGKDPLPHSGIPRSTTFGLTWTMRILHTALFVTDLDRSIAFYTEALGMRLLRRNEVEADRVSLAFVGYDDETDWSAIELCHWWDPQPHDVGSGFAHVAIAVDNVAATCAALDKRGVPITREPFEVAGGRKVLAYVEDPDGFPIELIERRK